MAFLYLIILIVFVVFGIAGRNYRSALFRRLDAKKHPLRMLYPLCSRLLDVVGRWECKRGKELRVSNTRSAYSRYLLKSLYVKENVEEEAYLYRVRKTAVMMAVGICGIFIAFAAQLASTGAKQVDRLTRGEYGQGVTSYELEVHYRGDEELVSIDVEQVKLDESRILELFESSYEEIWRQLLGDNASAQEVSRPLNLISQYNGIDIFWDIEEPELVGYNGDIKAGTDLKEGAVVNLFATFSMEGVVQIYNYPIRIVSPTLSARETLLQSIRKEIAANNDAYDKQVSLPHQLDGEPVFFQTIAHNHTYMILLLAIAALVAVFLFYDKKLENTVNQRKDQLMMDFARIVSKLSLLYDAGLSVHGAFERIVTDYERQQMEEDHRKGKRLGFRDVGMKQGRRGGVSSKNVQQIWEHNAQTFEVGKWNEVASGYAYMEMKLALEKIRSGVSEGDAYAQFGRRCGLQPYIKLGNLLERNLSKGTKGLQGLLKEEVDSAYEQRKRLARKKGEQASTKMLAPMTMLLLVVIIIVAVPAVLSMGL